MTAVVVMLGVIVALNAWAAMASARLRHEVRQHLRARDHGHGMRHLTAQGIDHATAPAFPESMLRDSEMPSVWRPGHARQVPRRTWR